MRLKLFFCVVLAVCLCPLVALAAAKDDKNSALGQAKTVEKSSKDAAKDAKAGKLENAKAKSGKGFDTPANSTGTVKAQQPVKKETAKEVADRENAAQKQREKERAKKYKLDDPKKAPPKP